MSWCLFRSYSAGTAEGGEEVAVLQAALGALGCLLPLMSSGEFLSSPCMPPLMEVLKRGPGMARGAGTDGQNTSAVAALQVLVDVVRRRFVQPSDKTHVLGMAMHVFSVLEVRGGGRGRKGEEGGGRARHRKCSVSAV
jgi:hypothetical protein